MKGLTKKQSDELFLRAQNAKKQGQTLSRVFSEFAKENGRSAGGIRNYYYKCVAEKKVFGLTAKSNEKFTESAENELIAAFLRERRNYRSIRKTSLYLADGDPVLALRLRNKFCNLMKKKHEKIESEMRSMDKIGAAYFDPYSAVRGRKNRKSILKKEIDDLLDKITRKCAAENEELKRKIVELESINRVGAVEKYSKIKSQEEKAVGAKEYFGKKGKQDKKEKIENL